MTPRSKVSTGSLSQVLLVFYEEPTDPNWVPSLSYSPALKMGFSEHRGTIAPALENALLAEGVPASTVRFCMVYLGGGYQKTNDRKSRNRTDEG